MLYFNSTINRRFKFIFHFISSLNLVQNKSLFRGASKRRVAFPWVSLREKRKNPLRPVIARSPSISLRTCPEHIRTLSVNSAKESVKIPHKLPHIRSGQGSEWQKRLHSIGNKERVLSFRPKGEILNFEEWHFCQIASSRSLSWACRRTARNDTWGSVIPRA